MKTWIKVLIVTLVIALPTVPLGQVIWPPNPMGPTPSGAQVPLFIVLAVFESLLLGLGVSFLVFGWPLVRKAGNSLGLTVAAYLGIGWLMASWWVHDGLHRSLDHSNLGGLLAIEYGFHVTLMVSAAIVGLFFVRALSAREVPEGAAANRAMPLDAARVETR